MKTNANCIYRGQRYAEIHGPKRKVIRLEAHYYQGGKWHKVKLSKKIPSSFVAAK